MEIINIDKDIVKSNHNQHISDNKYAPKHPFRMLIIGPSNCGKSNLVCNLLTNYLTFDRIYVYARDLSEDKYQLLMAFFNEIDRRKRRGKPLPKGKPLESQGCRGLPLPKGMGPTERGFGEGPTASFSEISTDECIIDANTLDPNNRNLIIFDDLISLGKRGQNRIIDLFTRARKRNCSLMYLAQTFFDIPKTIRLQANYLILFKVNDGRELQEIRKTLCTRISDKKFKDFYAKIANTPYAFMVIDCYAPDLNEHIRMGFDKLYNEDKDCFEAID